jgi:hypothetical protein
MLCQYKNLLGTPREGVHHYRIGGFALVDILLTFLIAFVISFIIKKSFWIVLLAVLFLGILLHRLFCVRTRLDKILFE